MLDIKLIIENPTLVKERLLKKGYDIDFDEVIKKDAEKRALQFEIESLNSLSQLLRLLDIISANK